MNHTLKNIFLFSLSLFCITNVYTQNKSNKGKEFWLGYGHNIIMSLGDPAAPINSQELTIYISTDLAATVTVSVNGTAWSQTVTIPANSVNSSILIPKTGANDARLLNEGLSTKGIHIVSDVPIVVYAHQYTAQSSAASMLMPVETFGYTYYSMNYHQQSNFPSSYSWFFVTASENNTRLEITPSDTTMLGWLPGNTYTVNLNKGEIYNVFGKQVNTYTGKDMTGSKVVSVAGSDGKCHPVALYSGSSRNVLLGPECYYIHPTTGEKVNSHGGELLMQQMFPANAWGTKYIVYHTVNNLSGNITTPYKNIYRVAVRNPSTIVKRNGVVLTGLQQNFFYEFSSTSGDVIEADQPILVAQYPTNSDQCGPPSNPSNPNAIGDPEMIFLSPIEQGIKSVIFYETRKTNIVLDFANIIVPVSGVSSMLFDGSPILPAEYVIHPVNPSYAVVVKRLMGPAGQHTITCDSSFVAINYGFGGYESYGYNAGCLVNNLNAKTEFKNTFNSTGMTDTFTCPKSPFRLFINLAYRATQIHWKLSQAAGLSPNADSIINNPVPVSSPIINGRQYYRYSLQQDFIFNAPGTYNIPFSYTAPDIDACNQTESDIIQIVVKPGPSADFSISGNGCAVDTLRFTGTSDNKNYNVDRYLWNFIDGTTQTTKDAAKKFTNTNPQLVKYTIFTDNGCIDDTSKIVTPNGLPLAKFGINGNLCANESLLFTDSSVVSGGTITNWWWSFGDGRIVNAPNGNSIVHKYTTPGTYTVKLVVASDKGCISDTAISTAVISNKPVARFGVSANGCLGDSILFSDSSSISAGTISSWKWIFGDGNSKLTTTNNPFFYKYSTTGNFTAMLVVLSGSACTDTTTRSVPISTMPVVNLGKDTSICGNGNIILNATNPGASYLWHDGATTPTYSANKSGLYWVNVKTGANCERKDSITLAFNSVPVFNLGSDTSICKSDTLILNATVSSAVSYLWNTGATTPTIKAYQAGLYWCEVNNGCTYRDSLTILAVKPSPTVSLGSDQTLCIGNTAVLDATNANSTYLWQDGSTNATYLVDKTGLYWVRVLNSSGCSARDSVNFTFNPAPIFNLGADTSICSKDTVTLNASAANASSYLWNTGATTATLKVYQAGLYWCEAKTGTCIFRDSLTILSLKPVPTVNLGPDQVLCVGNSVLLDATNANSTYLWQDGSTNATYQVDKTGLYWVRVLNSSGCSVRDSVNFTFNPAPIFNLGADTSICSKDTVTLNASAANATSYLWNTGATTATLKVYQAGLYWCEAKTGTCIFRDSLSILSVKPVPTVNLGPDQVLCAGNSVLLDATNANSTYLWQDGSTNATYRAVASGVYWVQVENNVACRVRDSVSITFKPLPAFTLGADTSICQGQALILSAAAANASKYTWNTGANTASITVTQTGLYWCETELNGCTFRDSVSLLTIKPNPVVNLGIDQTVCEGITVPLDATYLNSSYRWQDGSVNPVFNVTQQGIYHVEVNYNGCKKSDTVVINYILKPRFTLGPDQAHCPGYDIVLAPVVDPVWQLRWQDGSTGPTYTVTQPGDYSLTATNTCGSNTDAITVIKGYCKVIMPTAFTPNGDGLNDVLRVLGTEAVTEMELKIFNRWGQLVFETADKTKGWDGTIKNMKEPSGIFVYLLRFKENTSPQMQTIKGTFLLMR
jgi:gliding motility-associated-like protein